MWKRLPCVPMQNSRPWVCHQTVLELPSIWVLVLACIPYRWLDEATR